MVVDDAEARVSGLDDDAERVRNFALRDFRRAGVDREHEARATGSGPSTSASTELGQTFERNIRDDDTHRQGAARAARRPPRGLGRGTPGRATTASSS